MPTVRATEAEIAAFLAQQGMKDGVAAQLPPIHREPECEDDFLDDVMKLATSRGWLCVHFRAAMNRRGKWATHGKGDVEGWPDVLFVRSRLFVAELKFGKNKTTKEQDKWLAAFRAAGIEAFVWWPADWAEIERRLT